jgi:hypothetical protein
MDSADHRADQEARLLAARARVVARGRDPTVRRLVIAIGWPLSLVEVVLLRLRDRGDWPEDPAPEPVKPKPAPVPVPADPPPPRPAPVRPDIAAECKKIQEGWSDSEWAKRAGHRAEVPVPTGIDHNQKLFTRKYK